MVQHFKGQQVWHTLDPTKVPHLRCSTRICTIKRTLFLYIIPILNNRVHCVAFPPCSPCSDIAISTRYSMLFGLLCRVPCSPILHHPAMRPLSISCFGCAMLIDCHLNNTNKVSTLGRRKEGPKSRRAGPVMSQNQPAAPFRMRTCS